MSLLKNTTETYKKHIFKEFDVLDSINYETAISEINKTYSEMLLVNNDLEKTIVAYDAISNNLTNESALIVELNNYGYITNESGEAKERAESVLRELKFILGKIVEKFLKLFTDLKDWVLKFIDSNGIMIKTLDKKINNLNEPKKVYSLDHAEFNKLLPTIKDFGNNTEIHKMLTDLISSASSLKSHATQASLFDSPHFESNLKDLLECSKGRVSYLISTEEGKLKIDSDNIVKFKESEIKSRLLGVGNLKSMLNNLESFNNLSRKYVQDIVFLTKKLENVNGVKDERLLSHPHLTNNIKVALEANGKFTNNITHVIKGVMFVIASNIKCYENN